MEWLIGTGVAGKEGTKAQSLSQLPDVVAEPQERRLPMRKVMSLNPRRVKPMIDQIDACHYLVWRLELIG